MEIPLDAAFMQVAQEIVEANWSEAEWAEREADDWFQVGPYKGGYDATEGAFCFSYHSGDGSEYWFQFTLAEILEITSGRRQAASLRKAQ